MTDEKKKPTMKEIAEALAAAAKAKSAKKIADAESERIRLELKERAESARIAAMKSVFDDAMIVLNEACVEVRALKLHGIMPLAYDRRSKNDGTLDGKFVVDDRPNARDLEWTVALQVITNGDKWILGFAEGTSLHRGAGGSKIEPIIAACLYRYSTENYKWFDQLNPVREKDKTTGWARDVFGTMFAAIELS